VRTYDLAFNWPHNEHDVFIHSIARAARARRIRFLCVAKGEEDSIRRSVERRTLEVGLFLNTQADGINMESPRMLLCRVLKSKGTLVVEDPDDAPIYTDRALQLDYLRRGGIAVPPYSVVETRQRDKSNEFPVRRSKLGTTWVARPARGMGRNRVIIRGSRSIASSISRSNLRGCPRVIVMPQYTTALSAEGELRFLVWHLFGHVAVCSRRTGSRTYDFTDAISVPEQHTFAIARLASRMSKVTGLDWFMAEIVGLSGKGRFNYVVVEPPNALAGLGPGVKPLAETPDEVVEVAAERIVDIAWRRSRELSLSDGVKIVLSNYAQ
jgi:hypothetical protein